MRLYCRDDRHGPPKKSKQDDEDEEDLNDANYDEVRYRKSGSFIHPLIQRFHQFWANKDETSGQASHLSDTIV